MATYAFAALKTKGVCILCLTSNCSKNSNFSNRKSNSLSQTTAFKMLLRYLNIDLIKLIQLTSSVGNGLNDVDLSVELCADCSLIANDFLHLFQVFEDIRMQLDKFAKQVHDFMEEGDKDEERVREFGRRMNTGCMEDLISSNIVEKVRKETLEAVSRRLQNAVPRIALEIDVIPLATPENVDGDEHFSSASSEYGLEIVEAPESPEPEPVQIKIDDEYPQDHSAFDEFWQSSAVSSPATEDVSVEVDLSGYDLISNEVDSIPPPRPVPQVQKAIRTMPFAHRKRLAAANEATGSTKVSKVTTSTPQAGPSSSSSIFPCDYCEKTFNQACNLTTHHLSMHAISYLYDTGRIPSGISELRFSTALAEVLQNDQRTVKNCPYCSTTFRSKSSVKTHLLRQHLQQIIEVAGQIPSKIAHSLSHSLPKIVDKHLSKQTVTNFKCAPCEKYFPAKAVLDTHNLQRHTIDVLKGQIKDSVSEQFLNATLKRISVGAKTASRNSLGSYLYICPYCPKQIWNSLKVHVVTKHLDKLNQELDGIKSTSPFSSSIDALLSIPTIPSENIKMSDQNPDLSVKKPVVPKYKCTACGRICSTSIGLKKHFAINHLGSQKPWKCKHCESSFAVESYLSHHLATIHPSLTFSDRLPPGVSDQHFHRVVNGILGKCKKIVKDSGQEIHARNRLFKCPYCKKTFSQMCGMRSHIVRSHLDNVIEVIQNGGRAVGVELEDENDAMPKLEIMKVDKREDDVVDDDAILGI